MAAPRLRRTRIVCISDTHNFMPKLPKGDVLIHAGDLTNQGSYSELSKTVKWLEAADFEAKIIIAGNHDITLDSVFYNDHGSSFHNQSPQSPDACLALFTSSPSITYLSHNSATIRLTSPTGPRTEFTVFGSPYSPRHGLWAFYYDAPESPACDLPELWERIPLATDIVVTHTPPRAHRDKTDERRAAGCEALRQALWRVRPRLAVCGHIHDGRGAERVTWNLDGNQGPAFAEESVLPWTDPGEGNNKLSLVDLTGKHAPALVNDGSDPSRLHLRGSHSEPPSPAKLGTHAASSSDIVDPRVAGTPASPGNEVSVSGIVRMGDPSSPLSDREALPGRMARKETCVVNAAIMKSRYPHTGGKQFYKPIVVDINLPVREE